jgi:hypothetical protein
VFPCDELAVNFAEGAAEVDTAPRPMTFAGLAQHSPAALEKLDMSPTAQKYRGDQCYAFEEVAKVN